MYCNSMYLAKVENSGETGTGNKHNFSPVFLVTYYFKCQNYSMVCIQDSVAMVAINNLLNVKVKAPLQQKKVAVVRCPACQAVAIYVTEIVLVKTSWMS